MEIPLKLKYRTHKIVKQNKSGSGQSGASHTRVRGPQTYVYGSRVMLMSWPTGKTRMVAG